MEKIDEILEMYKNLSDREKVYFANKYNRILEQERLKSLELRKKLAEKINAKFG